MTLPSYVLVEKSIPLPSMIFNLRHHSVSNELERNTACHSRAGGNPEKRWPEKYINGISHHTNRSIEVFFLLSA
jgi:hypothetical protein